MNFWTKIMFEMKYLVPSSIFVVLLWIGLNARGNQGAKPEVDGPSEATLKKIASSNEIERLEILRQLGKGRVDLQARLLKWLGTVEEKEKKFAFVYLMGIYRLKDTVWTLVNIIELENPKTESEPHDELPLFSKYPVADALMRIGMPSIPAVIGRLETNDKELVVELGTKVIDGILGRELGEMAIKQAIDKQTDCDKRKKLEEALEFFTNKLRR